MGYGLNETFGIAFQNSFGGALTNPGSAHADVSSLIFLEGQSETMKLNIPPLIAEAMNAQFDEGASEAGPRTVDGDFTIQAKPIELGYLFKSVMGAAAVVNSDGIYAHTFTPPSTDFDEYAANVPCTLFKNLDVAGSAFLYFDCIGSNLELSITNGEFLTAKVAFVGGNFTQVASTFLATPAGRRFTWNTASVSIGGTGNGDFKELTVTMDESLEAEHTMNNQLYPSRVKRSDKRTVRVSGTLKFGNQDEFQQFLSQSERAFVVTFTGPTEIQSGYYETCEITLPKMRYSDYPPQGAANAGNLEVSFEGHGKFVAASSHSMQVVLTNTHAAY